MVGGLYFFLDHHCAGFQGVPFLPVIPYNATSITSMTVCWIGVELSVKTCITTTEINMIFELDIFAVKLVCIDFDSYFVNHQPPLLYLTAQ